jgi:hypothetical protein
MYQPIKRLTHSFESAALFFIILPCLCASLYFSQCTYHQPKYSYLFDLPTNIIMMCNLYFYNYFLRKKLTCWSILIGFASQKIKRRRVREENMTSR